MVSLVEKRSDELVLLLDTLSISDSTQVDQRKRILKAVKAVGCFTDQEYDTFAQKIPQETLPLVTQLRAQAKAALIALGGGADAVKAAEASRLAKEEQLILSFCSYNNDIRAFLLESIPQDERIPILVHAKLLAPHCVSPYAKKLLLEIIQKIPMEQRCTALEHFGSLLILAGDGRRQESALTKISDFLNLGSQNGRLLYEVSQLLQKIPFECWQAVLQSKDEPFKWLAVVKKSICFLEQIHACGFAQALNVFALVEENEYSESVLQNAGLIVRIFKAVPSIANILSCVACIPEEKQVAVVKDTVIALMLLDEQEYPMQEIVNIMQSPKAVIYKKLSQLLKPGTPWNFPFTFTRMFDKYPGKHVDLQAKIADLILNTEAPQLLNKLFELELDIDLNRVRLKSDEL